MNWYVEVFRNYSDFRGRAGKSEYWMFSFYNFLIVIILNIIDLLLGLTVKGQSFGLLSILYFAVSIIPNIAVTVRRLHDVGRSGWSILLCLIPIVGGIFLLISLLLNSDPEENEYGYNAHSSFKEDSSNVDSIISSVLILIFFSAILSFIAPIIQNKTKSLVESIGIFNVMIWGIIPISLSFAIKDKIKKNIFIVLGGIYIIYNLYAIFTLYHYKN